MYAIYVNIIQCLVQHLKDCFSQSSYVYVSILVYPNVPHLFQW